MNADELRAHRILFTRRVQRKLRKMFVEPFGPPSRCRNCGVDLTHTPGIAGRVPQGDEYGYCTPLCNAEHLGMA